MAWATNSFVETATAVLNIKAGLVTKRQNTTDHPLRLVYSKRGPSHLRHQSEIARGQKLESEIAAVRTDRDFLQRSLYEAAQVQRRLCAKQRSHDGNFEIAGEIFPVRHLSGDLVCVFDRGDEKLVAIGDISGKGLAAGMWLTYLVGMISSYSRDLSEPATIADAMNQDLCQLQSAPLTTLLLCRLTADGSFTYCNAGHPAALLFRKSGNAVETLDNGGPVLGAVPYAEYAGGTGSLEPGDTLLGFSDGILECRNHQGEFFGAEGILSAVKAAKTSSSNGLLFSLLATVQDFAGGRCSEDDISLLVVRRLEQTGREAN
jgi:serine phosphatase RsbU (regulator of sigma subunit)